MTRPGGILHENDFVSSLFADVLLMPIAEPNGESPTFAIVENAHLGHGGHSTSRVGKTDRRR